tara:strand:- start:3235 stop:3930 length:696 start_codon:yes stop_codon:yes gene_type:complete
MHKYILAIITTFCLITTNAFAGSFGMGVAGTMASVSASGSESEDTNTGTEQSVRDATAGNDFILGSVYAEYSFGDTEVFTFGVDYIPGTADVNRTTLSRTDTTADANEGQQQDGKRTANAELSDHITYYAELGKMNGIYGKVGFAQVDVKTKDTETHAGTSGLYPDKTLDAWTYGLGYKGEFGDRGVFKIEGFMTDYDSYSATNNSGKTSTKTVKADLDVVGASLRLGMKF